MPVLPIPKLSGNGSDLLEESAIRQIDQRPKRDRESPPQDAGDMRSPPKQPKTGLVLVQHTALSLGRIQGKQKQIHTEPTPGYPAASNRTHSSSRGKKPGTT
jgi:hypothetical protein